MPVKDKENIASLKAKITELENKNKELQQELEKLNKAQIKKPEIYKFLTDMLGADVSDKVLVDVIFNEGKEYSNQSKILGRPSVLGSATKQMRHVTPYSFIEHIIESKIYNANPQIKKNVLKDLKEPLKLFTSYQEGICLQESDYQKLKDDIKSIDDFYSIKMNTIKNKTIYYLINEDKLPLKWDSISVFNEDQKNKMRYEYGKKLKKFIDYGIDCLQEAIQDENTLSITCEALSRFILTLFNQRIYTAFPEEGNTLNYEIRLYKNGQEALVPKNKDYEVLTHAEINKKINTTKEDLDGRIRIVNNEGSMVQKTIKALETIDKIIGRYNAPMKTENVNIIIQEYNNKYNDKFTKLKIPVPTVDNDELKKYNEDLSKLNLKSLCHYHIAKHLYFVFDLKPLEDKVFVPILSSDSSVISSTKTKVFPSTDGSTQRDYCIKDGAKYRQDQVNAAKGYNKKVVFRSEMPDKDFQSLLTKKTLDHVYTSIMSFSSFADGFDELESYPKLILKTFANLIEYDYKKSSGSLITKVNSICENIIIFQDNIDTSVNTSGEVGTGTLSTHDFDFI